MGAVHLEAGQRGLGWRTAGREHAQRGSPAQEEARRNKRDSCVGMSWPMGRQVGMAFDNSRSARPAGNQTSGQ